MSAPQLRALAKGQREAPGFFVDLQNNGGYLAGLVKDFSSASLSLADAIGVIGDARKRGVLICPTTITQPFDQLRRNLGIIAAALESEQMKGRWLHCEGPFFSGKDGAIGAHPTAHIAPANVAMLEQMIEASRDTIFAITVGADVANICQVIEAAVKQGLKVFLGHHIPSISQLDEAVSAGATWCTHLWNGAPKLLERQGFVDYQLDSRCLGAMVIADGIHVQDHCLRLAFRVKARDQLIVVSDRSPLGGAPAQEGYWYNLWDKVACVVSKPTGGRMIVGPDGYFAGSWADMVQCMNYVLKLLMRWNVERGDDEQFSEDDFWQVGCLNPAAVLGRSVDELAQLVPLKLAIVSIC